MKDRTLRRIAVVALLAFVAFLIYQINANLNDKVTTMDATAVTVEETISADSVFIRDQIIVSGSGENAEYLVSSGDKVSIGQKLCIFFENDKAAADYQQLKKLNSEIEALKYLDSIVNNGTDGVKLDGSVYTEINQLLAEIRTGRLTGTQKNYASLAQLIVARDAGLYSKNVFKDKLAQLENESLQYKQSVDNESSFVSSGYSGYFFTEADGYESVFDIKSIDNLNIETLTWGKANPHKISDDTVGVVVDGFKWYLAAVVDIDKATVLSSMDTVSVYVPNVRSDSTVFTVEKIIREGEKAVVLLKSTVMTPDYLSTRFQPIDIVVGEYTGIKVPVNALHQKDGNWGVYCLEGSSVKFKKVNIVYQTESYYLLEIASSASQGLYLYDKILLGGK